MVDYISLSVNENKDYYDMLPTVAFAYRKFFPECKLILSTLTTIPKDIIKKLRSFVDGLFIYDAIKNIPTCNLAKIARQYTAANLPIGKTCMINDIDTIVLQRKFFEDRWNKRPAGYMLAIGKELYKGKKNAGNFPISYMAAESEVFRRLFTCSGMTWNNFISFMLRVRCPTGKEDIRKPFKVFSDESYIKVVSGTLQEKIFHQPRVFVPAVDSIARRTKFLDINKLIQNGYFEAHHLLPIHENIDKMKAICKFLGTDLRTIT